MIRFLSKKKSQNKNTNQKSKSINYLLPKGIKILEYYKDNICSIYEKKIHLYIDFFFFEFQNNFNKCSKICSKKHFSRTIMRNGWIPFVVLWKACNYNLFVFSSTYCWFFNLDLIFIRSWLGYKSMLHYCWSDWKGITTTGGLISTTKNDTSIHYIRQYIVYREVKWLYCIYGLDKGSDEMLNICAKSSYMWYIEF